MLYLNIHSTLDSVLNAFRANVTFDSIHKLEG